MKNKTTKLKINMIVAFISKILLILFGVISQRFVLKSFGSEINGLTSSISQFLIYFTLLESGLGLASIQALYKPLAENDQKKVSSILTATSIQYRRIGTIFLILTVCLSVLMPVITHSNLENRVVFCLTLLMGLSSVINYFFIGRYQVLLTADQKIYVLNFLDSFLGILFKIIHILMINAGYEVIPVYSIGLISPIVRIIVLRIYFKRNYPSISYNATPDFQATSKKRYVLTHQIVSMVTSHTDVTILTLLSTLAHVSVYSVYNFIYSNIQMVITSTFSTAVEPSFGKLVGSRSSHLGEYFEWYELLLTFIMTLVMSCVLIMTIPFIRLYTEGVEGINYIDPLLAVLFMVSIYCSLIRIPSLMMINTTGSFKETQKGAIIQAIMNLAISIPAFYAIGIKGLLVGTVVSSFYRMCDVIYYTYKSILKLEFKKWIKLFLVNVISMSLFIIYYMVFSPIVPDCWSEWMLLGFKCLIIGMLYFLFVFCLFYNKEFNKVIVIIKQKTLEKKRL